MNTKKIHQQNVGNAQPTANEASERPNELESDFKLLERTTLQLSMILHSIEFKKENYEQTSNTSSSNGWHHSIPQQLRSHLIARQIAAMLPIQGSDECNLVENMKESEKSIFEMANSKAEYYHLLSNKIYEIQDKLKIKRQKQNQMVQNEGGMVSSYTDSFSDLNGQQNGEMQNQEKSTTTETDLPSYGLAMNKENLFGQKELQSALLPIWDEMNMQAIAEPFRQPVDTVKLGIPDYSAIVKNPMDLSTIKKKLTTGQYSDPWQYIDDVWLMFQNAWLYNAKKSYVFNCCTQLSEIFNRAIDRAMQLLGYCCGQKQKYSPQQLTCNGSPTCIIARNEKYHIYSDSSNNAVKQFCEICFTDARGDVITLTDDSMQLCQIQKNKFIKIKNDHSAFEPLIDCIKCGRKQHQICVLYHAAISPNGFVCKNCVQMSGECQKEHKFNIRLLPHTQCSKHIETHVKDFIMKHGAITEVGKLHVRLVSSCKKIGHVKSGSSHSHISDGFPYRAKSIFAFQEVDGCDVCFFGMYVQEYNSECSPPNTRHVYIAYLDSVHFFKPRQYRTAVYHEILLGYMDYVKRMGYEMVHIWACPAPKGDDYIFNCHPPEQKMPSSKRLRDWYHEMVQKGQKDGIILKCNNIVNQIKEDMLTSAAELPYFDGDYLPILIEEHQKKKENQRKDAAKSKRPTCTEWQNDFSNFINKYKNEFFVIRLHSTESIAKQPPIQEPDPNIECDFLGDRASFLQFTQEKRYEFSSLRHVKYSTLGISYALHKGGNQFNYNCHHCKQSIKTRYHCTVCCDYDLCKMCKDSYGHEHIMEKFGLDMYEERLKQEETLRRRISFITYD